MKCDGKKINLSVLKGREASRGTTFVEQNAPLGRRNAADAPPADDSPVGL